MAYVKMKEIRKTLSKAIKYIINSDKTGQYHHVSSNFTRNVSEYMRNSELMLADVNNCVGGRVKNEILAYHVIQSFDPGETTPEQCHRIGEEFARRITNNEYKYIVATHLDRDHLHNHIIISSANEITHHKMRVSPNREHGTLKQWRQLSNEITAAENLSVITPRAYPKHSEDLAGIYTLAKGTSAKDLMRRRVELALQESEDYIQFTKTLREKYAVSVSMRGKRLVFQSLDTGFKIRDTKLGQAFDQSNLMARLRHEQVKEITFNKTMIASANKDSISVWIPKTQRKEIISIPTTCVMTDGNTYRAFLTANQDQIIMDEKRTYKRFCKPEDLYQNFAPPTIDMAALTTYATEANIGISDAQQRFYNYQAMQIDKLKDSAALLNALSEMDDDSTLKDEIDRLARSIEQERAEFQAELIAAGEEHANIDTSPRIKLREQRLNELGIKLKALQDFRKGKYRDQDPERGADEITTATRKHRRTR